MTPKHTNSAAAPERAYTAIAMLEAAMTLIDQIYTESAKGERIDILPDLGLAKRSLAAAQQRQLRHYDAARRLERKRG